MIELKPCPFCGGKAILKRVANGHKIMSLERSSDGFGGHIASSASAITDEWEVSCINGCCRSNRFSDEIYHADDGEVVFKHNGAIEVAEAWNKRNDKPNNHCTHYCKHCKYAISRPAYNETVGAYTDYVCSLTVKDGTGK